MHAGARTRWTVRLLLVGGLLGGWLASPAAQASTVRMTGGMGITAWPMELQLGDRSHAGVGIGISGRIMVRLFDHLRLQTGLLQGEFEQDDLSQLKRSLIFFGVEAELPLFLNAYATVGARAGGTHLVATQTLGTAGQQPRSVRDYDRWTPLVEPMASLGWLFADKFHVELEGGVALDYIDGGLHTSYTMLLAVYFRMWDSGW